MFSSPQFRTLNGKNCQFCPKSQHLSKFRRKSGKFGMFFKVAQVLKQIKTRNLISLKAG